MFHIILLHPQIPPNTGNVIRLCANAGCTLHLIAPLGFQLDDKSLQRAGMDYAQLTHVRVHADLQACRAALRGARIFAVETCGRTIYADVRFQPGDALLFGPESTGLPPAVLAEFAQEQQLVIPMQARNRSVNLSNAVALVVYEAWRQQEFAVPCRPPESSRT